MRSLSPVAGPSSLPASLGASPLAPPPAPASSPVPPSAVLPPSSIPFPSPAPPQPQNQTQTSTPSESSSSLSSPLTTLPPLSSFFDLPARPPSSSGSLRRRSSLRPGFWIPQSSLLRNESKDAPPGSAPGSGAVTPAMTGEAGKIRDPAAMSVSSDSRAGSEWGGDAGEGEVEFGEEAEDGDGAMSLDERERGEGEEATLRARREMERSKLDEIFGDAKMSPEMGPVRATARLPYLTRVTRLLTLETSPMPEIESEAALQRLMASSPIPPTPLSSAFRKVSRGGHNRYPESAVVDESSESESSDDERGGTLLAPAAGAGSALSTSSNSNSLGLGAPLSSGSTSNGTGASDREKSGIPIPERERDAESDFPDDVSMSEGSLWGMRGSPVLERSMWGRGMDLDVPPQALPSPYRSTPPPSSYGRKRKRSLSPSTPAPTPTTSSSSSTNHNPSNTAASQPIPIKRPRLSHLSTPTSTPQTPHSLLPPFLPSSPTASLPGGPSPRPGISGGLGLSAGVANASPRWARAGLGARGETPGQGYGFGLGIGIGLVGGGKEGREREMEGAGEGVRKMSLQE